MLIIEVLMDIIAAIYRNNGQQNTNVNGLFEQCYGG